MRRLLVPAALLVVAAAIGFVQVGRRAQGKERVFIHEFADTLIYQGVARFQARDYQGAVAAWEQYLRVAPPRADTVSVREMIEEARQAASRRR